jgi:hypothetical protein
MKPPIADWFHIVMRPAAREAGSEWSSDEPGPDPGKDGDRRRSSDCTGGSGTARPGMRNSHSRTRRAMHGFNGEHGDRTTGVPSRKLWRTLHKADSYLSSWALDSSTMLNDTARATSWNFSH